MGWRPPRTGREQQAGASGGLGACWVCAEAIRSQGLGTFERACRSGLLRVPPAVELSPWLVPTRSPPPPSSCRSGETLGGSQGRPQVHSTQPGGPPMGFHCLSPSRPAPCSSSCLFHPLSSMPPLLSNKNTPSVQRKCRGHHWFCEEALGISLLL